MKHWSPSLPVIRIASSHRPLDVIIDPVRPSIADPMRVLVHDQGRAARAAVHPFRAVDSAMWMRKFDRAWRVIGLSGFHSLQFESDVVRTAKPCLLQSGGAQHGSSDRPISDPLTPPPDGRRRKPFLWRHRSRSGVPTTGTSAILNQP